jgi:eukaryotic-like serine/threonine-protein kinase
MSAVQQPTRSKLPSKPPAFVEGSVEDVLESFEKRWIAEPNFLAEFIRTHGLADDVSTVCELIRSDLDRKYSAGCGVELGDYFTHYPNLQTNPDLVRAICYEDFRARTTRALPTPAERWQGIPELGNERWWTQLTRETSKISIQTSRSSTQTQTAIEPVLGKSFGEFRLVGLLGSGAFSKVFLASQPGLASRFVALKVVRRVFNEPTHLARLQHTGIVPLYSTHRIGEYTALCMPYCGAATLADWMAQEEPSVSRDGQSMVTTIRNAEKRVTQYRSSLKSTSLPGSCSLVASEDAMHESESSSVLDRIAPLGPRELPLWFARKIASALAHAHLRNVVHGDLKPANILIRNDGEPALIDFNLSQTDGDAPSAIAGGTLPYMSPEQLRMLMGRGVHLSACSDIFSFGVVMYQWIEGRMPFAVPTSTAEIDLEFAMDRLRVPTPMLSKHVSPGLRSILLKCLSFESAFRYADASELEEDLDREASFNPLKFAQEPVLQSRIPKWFKRNSVGVRHVAALAALIALILSIGIGWQWRERSLRMEAEQLVQGWRSGTRAQLDLLAVPALRSLSDVVSQLDQLTSTLVRSSSGQFQFLPVISRLATEERKDLQQELAVHLLVSSTLALDQPQACEPSIKSTLKRWMDLSHELHGDSPGPLFRHVHSVLQSSSQTLPQGAWKADVLEFSPEKLSSTERLLWIWIANQLGRTQGVVACLESVEPGPFQAGLYWTMMGDARTLLGDYAAARRAYALALQITGGANALRLRSAAVSERMETWSEAEVEYGRIIETQGPTASILADRARTREKLRRIGAAIQDLDAALEIEPSSARLHLMRARLLLTAGRNDDARADYLHAMQTHPTDAADWISRALAQLPKKPESALADLRAAQALEPYRFEVLQNLAHVLSEHLHDNEAALEPLNELLQLRPYNQMARAGRCVLYARQGIVQACLKDIEFLESAFSRLEPATLYQMACAHGLLSDQRSESMEVALRYLAQSVIRGYGADLLESDPDLDRLRNDPRFQMLLSMSKLVHGRTVAP